MPAEPSSTELIPGTPPLLALIGNVVAAMSRSPVLTRKAMQVERVEATPDGLALGVQARGINFLVDGAYRVELSVLRTTRERTLCDLRIVEGPGVPGKVVGVLFNWGLKLVPNVLLNELLKGKAGGAVHLEGDRVVVEHLPLVQWLLKRRRD